MNKQLTGHYNFCLGETPRKRPSNSQPSSGASKSRQARDELGKFFELLEVADDCKIAVLIGEHQVRVSCKSSAKTLKELLDQTGDNLENVEKALGIEVGDFKEFPKMQLERLRTETDCTTISETDFIC